MEEQYDARLWHHKVQRLIDLLWSIQKWWKKWIWSSHVQWFHLFRSMERQFAAWPWNVQKYQQWISDAWALEWRETCQMVGSKWNRKHWSDGHTWCTRIDVLVFTRWAIRISNQYRKCILADCKNFGWFCRNINWSPSLKKVGTSSSNYIGRS